MQKYIIIIIQLLILQLSLLATEYYVDDVANNGAGTSSNPFNNFSDALNAAQSGDIIYVFPGAYSENISTVRSGSSSQPITIKAQNPNDRPVIAYSGTVVNIGDQYIVIDGLIIDGQFANADVVRISSSGDNTVIRNCEIKNGTKDGVDLKEADDVLIESCEIHHMLAGSFTNQADAHGIVATGENNLTIRGCNIYYTSGDCFQTDPSRGYPLWDNVLIENCKLWTGPLPNDAANWNAGEIPGENAIDTKINESAASTSYRANITIKNVEAYGFAPGYVNNRAAFNMKEKIECTMEAVLAHDNEIAFRLRGPGSRGGAHVTMINCIAYNNIKTFRTEDDLELLKIFNATFDKNPGDDYFQNVSGGYDPAGLDVRNCLFMGSKPNEGNHSSNMLANNSFFSNAPNHDYHLNNSSSAIDAGDDIADVTTDFDGNPRPLGSYDVGAYEYDSATGGIDDNILGELPNRFFLGQNYPNPFNPNTNITFYVAKQGNVKLLIYNSLGQKVQTLQSAFLAPGQYSTQWDGRDSQGKAVSSGFYIYRLESGDGFQTRKMHLLR